MDTRRRKRHRGFPTLPLPRAVDVLRAAARFGTEHHLAAFATYMGHEKPSGGAFRSKLAAFRDWGLITRAANERIAFTELGRRLALPPDPDAVRADLQQAFLACDVFRETYENTAKGVPLTTEQIGNTAVHNLGISPTSKSDFARSFAVSAEAVGLATRHGDGTVELLAGTDSPVEAGGTASAETGIDTEDSDGRTASDDDSARKARSTAASVHRSEWPTSSGRVILEIESANPLPPACYGILGSVAEQLQRLAEALTDPDPEDEPVEP